MRVLGNATIMSRFVNEFVRASTCKATAKFRSAKLLSVDMASASVNQSIRLSTNSSHLKSVQPDRWHRQRFQRTWNKFLSDVGLCNVHLSPMLIGDRP